MTGDEGGFVIFDSRGPLPVERNSLRALARVWSPLRLWLLLDDERKVVEAWEAQCQANDRPRRKARAARCG